MTEEIAPAPPRRGGWRSSVLVVLTVICLVASTVAVWARATVLETDRFMEVVGPALDDPAFQVAVSEVVGDQVLVALDLETRVAGTLEGLDTLLTEAVLEAAAPGTAARDRLSQVDRPALAALAPGITAALETRVVDVVSRSVASEAVSSRLSGLVRRAHAGGVALVRGDLDQRPNVEVRAAEVRIDLVPLIAQALQEVLVELRDLLPDVAIPQVLDGQDAAGRELLAEALQTRLPTDFGQLTIMTGADLAGLQRAIRSIDRLVVLLVVLTVVMLGVTIATSRRRRRTVLQLAGGLTLGIAVAALLVQQLEAVVLGAITHPSGERVAGVLLGELARDLRSVAVLIGLAALATGVAAHVLAERSPLGSARGGPQRQATTEARTDDRTTYRALPRPPAASGAPNERNGR
jgi:hypothetical protein